jgi:hypothetical protein
VRADAVGRDGVEQQRVAVGRRFGDAGGRRRSRSAGAVDDDDRLAEGIGKLRSDDARDGVGCAAGRHGDDELNRTHGPGRLGICGKRPEEGYRQDGKMAQDQHLHAFHVRAPTDRLRSCRMG